MASRRLLRSPMVLSHTKARLETGESTAQQGTEMKLLVAMVAL